jgi:small-conductance mechanosensitive channel
MFASSNAHRNVASTSASKNLQKSEIRQNDLNQSENFRRTETNSSLDELKKNFDASKMLMLNLNERLEQAKRLLRDREKLQKLRKMKTKIRALKREASETIEESTKKIESEEIESFSNNLMQSISISEKVVTSTVSSQREDVTASRRRTVRLDKISLYHDKSIKKHRDYVRNLTTTFRLIFDDFSTKNSKIVYVMQSLAEEFKKT